MSEINNNNVWLVTGASSGIGLSLVLELLNNGYKVASFTRSKKDLEEKIPKDKIDNSLVLETDITSEKSIQDSVNQVIKKFGSIGVLVNNAGYGFVGSVEESTDQEFKSSFDVNLFAVLSIIRHVVPHMRKEKKGLIMNIGTYLSYIGTSNYSAYSGAKFALNGITQSLEQELKPFGIKVLLLSPGGFRTGFLNSGLKSAKNLIPEYNTQTMLDQWANIPTSYVKGDPERAAKAIIKVSKEDQNTLPNNIPLGSDSYEIQKANLEKLAKELEQWKEFSFSTDFPATN